MASSSINIVDLRCSQCGIELVGGEYDRVFFCAGCRRAFEAGSAGLQETQLLEIRYIPGEQGVSVHKLPVWMFDIDVLPAKSSARQKEKADGFFGSGRVFVPGFKMTSRGFYGDPGITITRAWYFSRIKGSPDRLVSGKADFEKLPSCETASIMASQFIEPILLSIIDPIVDVTGLELQITVKNRALVIIPFRRKGGRIGCLDLSDEYPAHAFSTCIDISG
jgi:hypothetical protein